MRKSLMLAAVLVAACEREEKVAAPTSEEAARLDDAEAMLNGILNEEEPAPEGTGSSQSN